MRSPSPLRIERAANGFIVHRSAALAPGAELPMVFDSFERLVEWMAVHFGEGWVQLSRPAKEPVSDNERRSAMKDLVSRAAQLDPVKGW